MKLLPYIAGRFPAWAIRGPFVGPITQRLRAAGGILSIYNESVVIREQIVIRKDEALAFVFCRIDLNGRPPGTWLTLVGGEVAIQDCNISCDEKDRKALQFAFDAAKRGGGKLPNGTW